MGTDTGNAQEGDELSPLSLQITSSALAAKEDSSRARGAAPRAVSGDATLTFTSGAVSLEFIELQLAPSVTCEGLAPEARAALARGVELRVSAPEGAADAHLCVDLTLRAPESAPGPSRAP